MKTYNTHAYSTIISLLLVGFLLVMTTGIFRLVLKEMSDNTGIWNHIQAIAAAESGQELALKNIKDHWFGFSDTISHDIQPETLLLSKEGTTPDNFRKKKDVFFSTLYRSQSKKYQGEVAGYGQQVIPLFYKDKKETYKVEGILDLVTVSWDSQSLVWNVLWDNSGISGIGDFTKTTLGSQKNISQTFSRVSIEDFMTTGNEKYLVLYNTSSTSIGYSLTATENFTMPEIEIITSWEIGWYKQNVSTKIKNNEFLYSIFSGKN